MREIQRGYKSLSETVNQINGLETGKIRIGAYTSITTNWLPNILKEFKRQYPFIEIQVYEGNASELDHWLEEDQIDFGIGTVHNHKWEFQALFEDPIMVIMNAHHELAKVDFISLEEIESVEFILPYSDSLFEVHNIFKKEQINPNVAYQIRGDETIISMVRSNLGISLLPDLLLSRCSTDIVIKPLKNKVFRQIGILMNTKRCAQTPSVNKIVYFTHEWMKKNS